LTDLEVAEKWLSKIERNRPNFKQVLQDIEDRGMVELQPKFEAEMKETLSAAKLPVKLEDVSKDLFESNNAPTTGYKKWYASFNRYFSVLSISSHSPFVGEVVNQRLVW